VKLTPRFALIFVLYATALLASEALLDYNSGRDSLRSATISELLATAIEKQAALNEWVEAKKADIAMLAADPAAVESAAALVAAPTGSPEAQAAHDRLVTEIQPRVVGGEFLVLILMDPQTGQVIAATDPSEEGKFQEDRPFFINGKLGPYVQNIYYSVSLQAVAMTASAPLRAPDGRLLGVLAGRLDLAEMNAIITRGTGLRQTDDAYLLNRSSLFVTQPRFLADPAVLRIGLQTAGSAQTEAGRRCLASNSGIVEAPDYRGVPALVVYRWLPERELCLIVKLDQAEAFAPIRAFGGTVAAIGALALLVAAALAAVLARSFTRPILALQAGAARFGRGELEVRLPETPRDELGELAREFNQMAAALSEKENQLRAYSLELEQRVADRTAELQQTEERFRLVTETSPNAMVMVGRDGKISFVNQTAVALFGYRREELLGQPLELLVPERFRAEHPALRDSFFANPLSRPMGQGRELFALRQDDSEVPVEIALSPVETGEGVFTLATITDITERKRAEEALNQQRQSYQTLLTAMSDLGTGVAVANEKARLIYVNEAFCRIVGYAAEELLNLPSTWDLIPPADLAILQAQFQQHVRGEPAPEHVDLTMIRKDRLHVDAEMSIKSLADHEGLKFILITRDITERKRAAETLARYAEELRRSNADLEQFAYVASHDLQEPLRMVSSYVQLLARRYQGKFDADADEFIHYAVDGATRMQQLINDLLAYSRVDTRGKAFVPTDCEAVLEQTLDNLQIAIEESGAAITHDHLPTLLADEGQLVQLFQNLISNALKFHGPEPPRIHVSARLQSGLSQTETGPLSAIGHAERPSAHWLFAIRDNGIGLDPQFAERIFIIFQRLHTRVEHPGTGIGLAICKKIVERHGGRIWVDSAPGQGTTFYFTIPNRGGNHHRKEPTD
jgi:PAS domain S-box-containing protein